MQHMTPFHLPMQGVPAVPAVMLGQPQRPQGDLAATLGDAWARSAEQPHLQAASSSHLPASTTARVPVGGMLVPSNREYLH